MYAALAHTHTRRNRVTERIFSMSNQAPSASIDGKQSPSSTPLSPEDPRTTVPVSKPRSEMSGCLIIFKFIFWIAVSFGFLILFAMAWPSFVRSPKCSHMILCISNLKHLEGAREQAVMDGKTNPVMADLCGPTAYIKVTPVCPASKATYPMPPLGGTFLCPNPGVSGDDVYTHSLYIND
jgi:hypothetical protein